MSVDARQSPLVSVMMPVYNSAAHVAAAVESVIEQTFTDWELIIIDDGSTDDTWHIVSGLAEEDSRIHIYAIEHGGRGVARNRCLEKAGGKYIAACDSDDISLPERFEKQVSFLETHPEIDVVGGQICSFREKPVCERPNIINWPVCHKDIAAGFRRYKMKMPNAAAMIRRKCFDDIGPYDESLLRAQDYDFFKRLYLNDRYFHNLPDVLVLYRQPAPICTLNHFLKTQTYSLYVDVKHIGLFQHFDVFKTSRFFKIMRVYLVMKYVLYYVPKTRLNLLLKEKRGVS